MALTELYNTCYDYFRQQASKACNCINFEPTKKYCAFWFCPSVCNSSASDTDSFSDINTGPGFQIYKDCTSTLTAATIGGKLTIWFCTLQSKTKLTKRQVGQVCLNILSDYFKRHHLLCCKKMWYLLHVLKTELLIVFFKYSMQCWTLSQHPYLT